MNSASKFSNTRNYENHLPEAGQTERDVAICVLLLAGKPFSEWSPWHEFRYEDLSWHPVSAGKEWFNCLSAKCKSYGI